MIQEIAMLIIFGLIAYLSKMSLSKLDTKKIAKQLGGLLISLPRPIMMIIMAIPEQLVMASFEPSMEMSKRILVSIAMYIIHFAWNGMVMKPEKSYNELVWIIGTALYALKILGVKKQTAIALLAADSVMTLSLRGLA